MIRFKFLRYKNLLGFGDNWTTVRLDAAPHTLIIGENGAGKSTMIEALHFVLFGKPFRAINKPTIINSINGRDLLVEVEFETNGRIYKVERGLKPTVFNIFVDGKPLDAEAASKDMQEHLERQILKCSAKAFTQVVVLGSSSYVPFMRLPAAARREVIEGLLDIEVFSQMNKVLKERITLTAEKLDAASREKTARESQRMLAEQYQAQLRQSQLGHLESEITKLDAQITQTTEKYAGITAKLVERPSQTSNIQKQQRLLQEATRKEGTFQQKIGLLNKRLEFYNNNDQCPTCQQPIAAEHKATMQQDTEAKLTELRKKEEKLQELRTQVESALAELTLTQQQHDALTREADQCDLVLREAQRARDVYQAQRDNWKPPADDGSVLRPEQIDVESIQGAITALEEQKHVQGMVQSLLKDTGIKSRIIQHYLPLINTVINEYLVAMDFPIQFVLDEAFEETIMSRYRDEYSYENFSDGEKKRIDLALLFAWREVARRKNSTHTNLLIMDEVLDSSLDGAGVEEFLKLLYTVENDKNVFIISHRTDQLVDKFAQVLTFESVKGFSQLKTGEL